MDGEPLAMEPSRQAGSLPFGFAWSRRSSAKAADERRATGLRGGAVAGAAVLRFPCGRDGSSGESWSGGGALDGGGSLRGGPVERLAATLGGGLRGRWAAPPRAGKGETERENGASAAPLQACHTQTGVPQIAAQFSLGKCDCVQSQRWRSTGSVGAQNLQPLSLAKVKAEACSSPSRPPQSPGAEARPPDPHPVGPGRRCRPGYHRRPQPLNRSRESIQP